MATLLKLGPADAGRPLALEEFLTAEYEEGPRYELIDGRLAVAPEPNPPAKLLEMWALFKLHAYTQTHPEVANLACAGSHVFVAGEEVVVAPEPDVAVYRHFPLDQPFADIRWQEQSPLLVVEVLDPDKAEKDLVRNVRLYLWVPSIREYWIIDPRPIPDRPSLIVHRRTGNRWRNLRMPFGESYRTRLLPDFELVVDPRR